MADSTRRGFVTGGTWCVDINKVVSHWPQEDGLAEYLGEERANGGSGSNFALDMRQLDPEMPLETIALNCASAEVFAYVKPLPCPFIVKSTPLQSGAVQPNL